MPAGLDANLVLFIRSAVCSAMALQALLLMRARQGSVWTTGRLVGELKTHPKTVERVLRRFETAGLIARQAEGYVWRPALPVLEELSGALEQAHAKRPAPVRQAISSAFDRELHSFADAFRIGGR
jgi:hypothetical protein